jgi:hypothetical protein
VFFSFCHPFWPDDLFDVVCLDCFLPEVWITKYPRLEDTDDEGAATYRHRQPLGQHVVVGFIAGDAADALSQLSEADIFRRGLAQLDEMFGNLQSSQPVNAPGAPQFESCSFKTCSGVEHQKSAQLPNCEASEMFFTKHDLLPWSCEALNCQKCYPWSSEVHNCQSNPALFHFQGGMVVNWAEQSFIGGGYSHPSINAHGARDALAKPVGSIYFAGEATHPGVSPCLQAAN